MKTLTTLEQLRGFERFTSHPLYPMTEIEFWSIVQRGLEIRMEALIPWQERLK